MGLTGVTEHRRDSAVGQSREPWWTARVRLVVVFNCSLLDLGLPPVGDRFLRGVLWMVTVRRVQHGGLVLETAV